MADDLPGFIPRVLQLDDVSLLRADEAVLNAMVDGWRAQMLARGLAVSTITARCSLIGRFVEFTNEYPWRWRPLDVDQFLADLRSRETPIELSTLRLPARHERLQEGGGVRNRQRRQRREALRDLCRNRPCHCGTPVVPDQVHPLRAAGIDQRADVFNQFGHAVIPATRRPCAAEIAPLVGG